MLDVSLVLSGEQVGSRNNTQLHSERDGSFPEVSLQMFLLLSTHLSNPPPPPPPNQLSQQIIDSFNGKRTKERKQEDGPLFPDSSRRWAVTRMKEDESAHQEKGTSGGGLGESPGVPVFLQPKLEAASSAPTIPTQLQQTETSR